MVSSPPSPRPEIVLSTVIAVATLLFLLQCGHGLAVKSGTADELGAHIPAGILHWKSGETSGGLANPPLGQLLVAAGPILTGTANHPLGDDPRHLLPARLPVVLLGLATLLVIGRFAGSVGGPGAAAGALLAASMSPNLIAHSRLATLDLPVTAFFAFAGLLAWRWVRRPSIGGLVAFALAIGAAANIKFTGLHALPALVAGAALLPAAGPMRLRRASWLAISGLVGVAAVAWASYGFGAMAYGMPVAWVEGIQGKFEHGAAGHFAYLFGERKLEGFPHYFLVAFGVKVPVAILLTATAGGVTLLRGGGNAREASSDPNGFAAFVILPALWVFAAMSLVHRVDIGLRQVLPALPAMLACAGIGGAALIRRGGGSRWAVAALVAWLAGSAAFITPDHLSYFHELVGGPSRGDRILIDSNLDWGQDETRFRSWATGRDVHVNPRRPTTGLVAVNVNALHGLLERDDLRRRWISRLTPIRTVGRTWRIAAVDEETLRSAAERDPVAALDYAWWLVGVDRATEALPYLERNDLSGHAIHGPGWWRVTAEARLALGELPSAYRAALQSDDADLTAEIAWRSSPPNAPDRVQKVVNALARRGQDEAARILAGERLGLDPFTVQPVPTDAPPWAEAARWRDLGRERDALGLVGEVLSRHPDNEDALWLYGELVVRRKLGLTEFEWPDVDWSDAGRR